MYSIELFYDIFGEKNFLDKYMEYKDSIEFIKMCKDTCVSVEPCLVVKNIKTKKEYDEIVKNYLKVKGEIDRFMDCSINEVKTMSLYDIKSQIKNFYNEKGYNDLPSHIIKEIEKTASTIYTTLNKY